MIKLSSRNDYETLVKKMYSPLRKYYADDASTVQLPSRINTSYSQFAADFESFARPLWGLSGLCFYTSDYETIAMITKMIVNGTNPDSNSYWGG